MTVLLLVMVMVVRVSAGGAGCGCRSMGWYSRCELGPAGDIPACVSDATESLLLDAKMARSLDGRSFALTPRLSNLKVLNLPYEALTEDLFGDVRTLLYLDLSANRLRHVGAAAFRRVRCNRLGLDANRLRSVADGAFQNVTSLALHDNLLTSLSAQVFLPRSQVRELDLRRNRLVALPSALRLRLPTLERLHLHGNPWRCDCALLGEVRLLGDVISSSPAPGPQCEEPPQLRGVALVDLGRHLTCP